MKFSTEGLRLAGMDLVAPLSVDVVMDPDEELDGQGAQSLSFQHIARVLPERRVSGVALWGHKPVFAKLFYGSNARRYWQREIDGARMLRSAAVRSPRLLETGATADGGGFVVLYEVIESAANLTEDSIDGLSEAVRLLAQLHEANLIQSDVHLDNFVRSGETVYVVDADGLRRAQLLRHHFANLALLLAQRAPWYDSDIQLHWQNYADVRGEYVANMGSVDQLRKLTSDERRQRVRRYLKKTQRECTEFVRRKRFSREFLCLRAHWPQLERFMIFPESYVGEGTPLKLGNSATVVRCVIGDTSYVVKRYNIKGFGHRLRRWIKRRARNAWTNGHWLSFLGIPTARPVALLEQRFGWFVGVCYLVMEDAGDRHLGQILTSDPECFDELSASAVALLKKLKAAGITHGDMKATNFLVDEASLQMTIIDYDALAEGGLDMDLQRFLANWEDQPELKQRWRATLAANGL